MRHSKNNIKATKKVVCIVVHVHPLLVGDFPLGEYRSSRFKSPTETILILTSDRRHFCLSNSRPGQAQQISAELQDVCKPGCSCISPGEQWQEPQGWCTRMFLLPLEVTWSDPANDLKPNLINPNHRVPPMFWEVLTGNATQPCFVKQLGVVPFRNILKMSEMFDPICWGKWYMIWISQAPWIKPCWFQ